MIALVSMFSDEFSPLSEVTWDRNKALYCKQNNYLGFNFRIPDWLQHGGYWKIHFIKEVMSLPLFYGRPEWIWALGCDTLVTNFDRNMLERVLEIEDEMAFIIATDINGDNADSFLIRNNDRGVGIINWLLEVEKDYGTEQGAIHYAIEGDFPAFTGCTRRVPQRAINSYDYKLYGPGEPNKDIFGTNGNWEPGDLLIHWPGFMGDVPKRVALAEEWLQKVQY